MSLRIPLQKLNEIVSKDFEHISSDDRDEMAIPSYLHRNPLIRWLMWKRYDYISVLSEFSMDMSVLEFGCGVGVFLPELHARCNRVYAYDRFPEYAKRLGKEYHLNVRFIDDLSEVPDDSLDLIIAADVLEHIRENDLTAYLTIFSQKLKHRGRLIVSGPTENMTYKIGRLLAGFAGKGDYHHTDINHLIHVIGAYFALERTKFLPFRWPPFLFKVCAFRKCSTT